MTVSMPHLSALQGLFPDSDPLLDGLDCYVVGGAVRDALLGLPAGDRDWVVVGATPEQLAQRGFIPVGGDFPVFLHPKTKEEFALARTERKSGRGYKGFTFYTGEDVSLADDLRRRDLTVNALAVDIQGQLYDPLNGYQDLKDKVLRHIGEAFIEDPVRLLRLARFAARFSDFSIADQTLALAKELVANGEVDALVPERVWQELHKGLKTAHPLRMLQVLESCSALARVMPGLVINAPVETALNCAVEKSLNPEQRFALLCHQSTGIQAIAEHLRAPSAYKELALLLPMFMADAVEANEVESVADLLRRCDVLRRPERFALMLAAAQCASDVDTSRWATYAQAFAGIDAGAIAKAHAGQGKQIPAAVWQARLSALALIF